MFNDSNCSRGNATQYVWTRAKYGPSSDDTNNVATSTTNMVATTRAYMADTTIPSTVSTICTARAAIASVRRKWFCPTTNYLS